MFIFVVVYWSIDVFKFVKLLFVWLGVFKLSDLLGNRCGILVLFILMLVFWWYWFVIVIIVDNFFIVGLFLFWFVLSIIWFVVFELRFDLIIVVYIVLIMVFCSFVNCSLFIMKSCFIIERNWFVFCVCLFLCGLNIWINCCWF